MNVKVLNFKNEIKNLFFNPSEKIKKWGNDNTLPNRVINLYESIPEHSAAIDFISGELVGKGINGLDFLIYKRLVLDYLLFGGFTLEINKRRNGDNVIKYIDISKCRLTEKGDKIAYCEQWGCVKNAVDYYPISNNINSSGIYLFKGFRSREDYPKPYYLSAFKSLDTLNCIFDFHNNSASNGFSPNILINFNNGTVDTETQDDIERAIKSKFTGDSGQRFILAFNDNKESAVTIEKLQDDNLDTKFETLQKFLRNEILIAHRITSPQLIGVLQENQGFSKVEWAESLEVFKQTTIASLEQELFYGLDLLFNNKTQRL